MDKGWQLVGISLTLRFVVPQQRLCGRPSVELDRNVIINRRYGFGRKWIYPVARYSPTVFHGLHKNFLARASAEI